MGDTPMKDDNAEEEQEVNNFEDADDAWNEYGDGDDDAAGWDDEDDDDDMDDVVKQDLPPLHAIDVFAGQRNLSMDTPVYQNAIAPIFQRLYRTTEVLTSIQ